MKKNNNGHRLSRRGFAKVVTASLVSSKLALSELSYASAYVNKGAKPRVVVVGGGAGGATAAKALAHDSQGEIEVILIEPNKRYYSCFYSNLYIGGFRDLESLGHGYQNLAFVHDVTVVHDWVVSVDRDNRQVQLGSGTHVAYDRLVMSPGIDLDYSSLPGYSLELSQTMPHAWKSGTQLALLKAQIVAMNQGGTYMMLAPPNPYRCPPGPYERVSMVAHYFKQHNPSAKIIILDAKESFSKQSLFSEAWTRHYGDMIEWIPASVHGGISEVESNAMTIETELEQFKADVVNAIPAQRAGHIALLAGLTNEAGWCNINPENMQSLVDDNIYVLGDSAVAAAMPKSAFSANSQAKVAAQAIRAELTGSSIVRTQYANICWSLLAEDESIKIGAKYNAGKEKIESINSFISKVGETKQQRARTYHESQAWYKSITDDMFL